MRSLRTPKVNWASMVGLCLALVLSIGTHAWAQGRQTGTVPGSLRDSTDAVLVGVTLTLTSDALQGSRMTVSDLNGNYPSLIRREVLAAPGADPRGAEDLPVSSWVTGRCRCPPDSRPDQTPVPNTLITPPLPWR